MAKCQEQHRNQSCAAIRKAPYQVTITSEWKTLWLDPRIMKELCLSWARNFVHYVEYFKIFHWNSIFEHDGLIYSTNIVCICMIYIIYTRLCRWYNHLFVGMICNYLILNHIRTVFNYLGFNLTAHLLLYNKYIAWRSSSWYLHFFWCDHHYLQYSLMRLKS